MTAKSDNYAPILHRLTHQTLSLTLGCPVNDNPLGADEKVVDSGRKAIFCPQYSSVDLYFPAPAWPH
jgi:hypothetical protein